MGRITKTGPANPALRSSAPAGEDLPFYPGIFQPEPPIPAVGVIGVPGQKEGLKTISGTLAALEHCRILAASLLQHDTRKGDRTRLASQLLKLAKMMPSIGK